jgi:hypothetical protein
MKTTTTFAVPELQLLIAAAQDRLGKLRIGAATAEKQPRMEDPHRDRYYQLSDEAELFELLAAKCISAKHNPAITFDLCDVERAIEAVAPLSRMNMRRLDRSLKPLTANLTVLAATMVHDSY